MVGISKKTLLFLYKHPLGGGRRPTHKILCDISIPGFSMMGISKMTSVFLYKPPNPLWGGGEEPTLKILYDISILGFSMVGISKMTNDPQWKY